MSNRYLKKYVNGGQQDGSTLSMLGGLGMATGNPYGMAAGLALTTAGSLMAAKKQKEDAAKAEALMKTNQVQSDNRMNAQFLSTYPTKGIIGSEMYKNGGLLKKYAAGGVLPVSPEAGVVVGPSHENGGVDAGNGNEVQGGEMVTVGGKVFSRKFTPEAIAVTQSSLYKNYINKKTELSSMLEDATTNTVDKSTITRELQKLTDPLDIIFAKQHEYNVANGLPEGGEETTEAANGGDLKNYNIPRVDYDRDKAPRVGSYLLPDINRPSYKDENGGYRSEYKMGINDGINEVNIPTVVNGEQLTEDEAIKRYNETGLHMGKYNTIQEANIAAQKRTAKYNFLQNPIENQSVKIELANGGTMKRKYDGGGTLLKKQYGYNNWNNLPQGEEQQTGLLSNTDNQTYANPNIVPIKQPSAFSPFNYNSNPLLKYGNTVKLPNQTPEPFSANQNPSPTNSLDLKTNYTTNNPNIVSNATVPTPDSPSKFNPNSVLKGGQFLDNALNFYLTRNTPKIPNQNLNVAPRLETKFNIRPQLQEVRNQFEGLSKNIDRQTTDKGNAMSNKQAAFVSTLKNTNTLLGQKENIEQGLRNESNKVIAETTNSNNVITQNNNMQKAIRLGDIQSRDSKNMENFVGDRKFADMDAQEQANDQTALRMYTQALDKNGVVSRNGLVEMMGGEEQYQRWVKRNKIDTSKITT